MSSLESSSSSPDKKNEANEAELEIGDVIESKIDSQQQENDVMGEILKGLTEQTEILKRVEIQNQQLIKINNVNTQRLHRDITNVASKISTISGFMYFFVFVGYMAFLYLSPWIKKLREEKESVEQNP
ncbi:hypothetical protein CANMA_003665 [Candida margitis]|uniref:uncharacterized protein n=1 Tax=Candida margitis TaxID=1775924 RepID=UPI0022271623|nr:uncharacterized protein CANMA_003665 [Candida margitis]KAI5962013.1 hypothetical protein CANMA_003665 [Candida margitis]